MSVLVTGSAGFIGFHFCKKLIQEGIDVIGIDNFNSYYEKSLKYDRNNEIIRFSNHFSSNYYLEKTSLEDQESLENIFNKYKPKKVVNLAAQAGVRYSITNPKAYINSNLQGFGNILESCRNHEVEHLIYASSSSVYGGNTNLPFKESNSVDHPVSLYAATKKSNELMAHAYSHLYGIPSTGLRFFTVYGPWGRPDMALFLFTKAMIHGKEINIFNNGKMIRDFTYIDDIIESLYRVLNKIPEGNKHFDTNQPDPSTSWAPHQIFNIGNSNPTPLMEYIDELEIALNITAKKIYLPMQAGDVVATAADTSALEKAIGFKPNTTIKEGIRNFVSWYRDYYQVSQKH